MNPSKRTLESDCQEILNKLKVILQKDCTVRNFERMVAALIGKLLGVPIAVASSGYQHGGDAGPGGRQQRHFRIECKRYSDSSSLKIRELLGEIDQAISRDESLEAWILVTTRTAPEQLIETLTKKGNNIGVPIIVLDWEEKGITSLAALCSVEPDFVREYVTDEAAQLVSDIQPYSSERKESLRKELQAWCPGFENLRSKSIDILDKIWKEPRESNARLGQNAAGGQEPRKIKRLSVSSSLNSWWTDHAKEDSPIVVYGWEGVGKTWAVLDWFIDTKIHHPIILVTSSSSLAGTTRFTETSIKRFIATLLLEITQTCDVDHWSRRVNRLFLRPLGEGPVITLFIDGLNQEPSVPWLMFFKVLQSETFSGRVCLISTTRTHHFENRLALLKGLSVPAQSLTVDVYDNSPGSELDQMLAFHGLNQDDFHPDVLELAQNPRMFDLVVRYGNKLEDPSQITVHQLLWEYGKDTFGNRAGISVSENEWRGFLRRIAKKLSEGTQDFSENLIAEMTNLHILSKDQVYARFSEIVDGSFVEKDTKGFYKLSPTIIPHALAVALLDCFITDKYSPDEIRSKLLEWLDPIAGYDQKSQILRAAVSVLTVSIVDTEIVSNLMRELVLAWLQSQNIEESHKAEIKILAPHIVDALLYTIENSRDYAYLSSRITAVNALRSIPKDDISALITIVKRVNDWYSVISQDAIPRRMSNPEYANRVSRRFQNRIGSDAPGDYTVLGKSIKIEAYSDGSLLSLTPSIIENFPLVPTIQVLELATISIAIRGYIEGWEGLRWLLLLNTVDPSEMSKELKRRSEVFLEYPRESGLHVDIPVSVAALLLSLTNNKQDNLSAHEMNLSCENMRNYESDYLSEPGKNIMFPLERRHADEVLLNRTYSILHRISMTKELWLDPTFAPPQAFIDEVSDFGRDFDIGMLQRSRGLTIEEHNFDILEIALARCAPDILADLLRSRLQNTEYDENTSRYWSAIFARTHILLAGQDEEISIRELRQEGREDNVRDESYVSIQLMLIELASKNSLDQMTSVIEAELDPIYSMITSVLKSPSSKDIDLLVSRYGNSCESKQTNLLVLLSLCDIELCEISWQWVEHFLEKEETNTRRLAFTTLCKADSVKLGHYLLSNDWSWNPEEDFLINHYGSTAVIDATTDLPFDHIVSLLAPWKLLEAVKIRGSDPTELRIVVELIDKIIITENPIEFDPGAEIEVDCTSQQSEPCSISVSPMKEIEDDTIILTGISLGAEGKILAHQRAQDIALERICKARASGADFLLVNLNAEDFLPVIQQFPDMVNRWLEGYDELTVDFKQRLRLAERAFCSLCEALLHLVPDKGVKLWKSLNSSHINKCPGAAGVDDIIHMVFRAPDSPEVDELRTELLSLKSSNTDQSLLEIVIASRYNGKTDWLQAFIKEDKATNIQWRIMRSTILEGFLCQDELPISSAWPDREIKTEMEWLHIFSACNKWREACSKHWWESYVSASTIDEAYASWVLFLKSADNRARIWMFDMINDSTSMNDLDNLKKSNMLANISFLFEAMNKRQSELEDKFLQRRIFKGIGPWV